MQEEEVREIMSIIKSNYQNFSINEEVINEWCRRLSIYDYEDIKHQLDSYLEYGEEPPRINQLTYGVTPKEKKEEKFNGYVYCSKCGKAYTDLKKVDECYERDLDIEYILKMCIKFNLNPNDYFGDINRVSLASINRNYDNFIIKLGQLQKEKNILSGNELKGLRGYYKNVIMKKK